MSEIVARLHTPQKAERWVDRWGCWAMCKGQYNNSNNPLHLYNTLQFTQGFYVHFLIEAAQ